MQGRFFLGVGCVCTVCNRGCCTTVRMLPRRRAMLELPLLPSLPRLLLLPPPLPLPPRRLLPRLPLVTRVKLPPWASLVFPLLSRETSLAQHIVCFRRFYSVLTLVECGFPYTLSCLLKIVRCAVMHADNSVLIDVDVPFCLSLLSPDTESHSLPTITLQHCC